MSKSKRKALAVPADGEADEGLFFNREVSWLHFNFRVLALARDLSIPLLERLRFLAISSSNLDEFFEIRVAGLKQHIALDVGFTGSDEHSPVEVFRRVSDLAHLLVEEQYRVLNEELLPELEENGIHVLKRSRWNANQKDWIRSYFEDKVLPVLTPVALDPAHPFPRILNKSLNFAVAVKGKDAFGRTSRMAVVQAPRLLPRLIQLPQEISDVPHGFVMLSSVIHDQVTKLFPGMKVTGCFQFRVTRDSDLWVEEEEVDDLLKALKGELPGRRFGGAARLEVADNMAEDMQEFLLGQFGLAERDLYRVNGPVNVNRLMALCELVDRPDLKYRPFVPGVPPQMKPGNSMFQVMRQGDILLHHPYQSFTPVVQLVREAASDPDVIAIKQTVYRTGENSVMNECLLEAAAAGKEVTAVVELRARFDEANNIDLATRLQEAGAKVVYGMVGHKAHAKMLLIVRRESGGRLRRYVHLGTGNYHQGTARLYTDLGLLTTREDICEDVHNVFTQLTGLGAFTEHHQVLQAPFTLHREMIKCIDAETQAASEGRKARIIAKMNSLLEPQIIHALYEASQAGVQIDLIVRGICCLRPGVPGLSENIRVRSVLGRFLEHSRLFYFYAEGKEVTYASSADWMQRNFFRRVEVTFPLRKHTRQRAIEEAFDEYFKDNVGTWELGADGRYVRIKRDKNEPLYSAQQALLEKWADVMEVG